MSEELLSLTDEQLAQYEAVINKIRESKKYKEFLEVRAERHKEVKAAVAENRYIKIPAKLEKKEKKLIRSMFADFEKVARDIPGATKNRPQSKKNFFQKIFKRKDKDYYVPYHVASAFWKELEQPGTFKEEYNIGVNHYNNQQNSGKPKEETKVETKHSENTQENTQQTTSNDTHSYEQKSANTHSTESAKGENKMNFEDLQNKYDDHIANNTGSAEELWNMANQLELNDKSGEHTRYVPYAIVDRDPTFKPETMFGIITNNANEGYASEFKDDPSSEIGAYIADVNALSLLAEHNPNLSSQSRLLNTLNKISKETVACYQEGKSYDKEASTYFSMFALNIIPAYAKCEYNTPKQADLALQNIANITKNLEAYERNPHDVINTVHSIVNNSETDKEVATSAFRALNLVSPQNSEEASKMLSLYKTLSLDNPDLAEASISKMRKIFNDFPHDEKLQKECLSTLESLNGFRSKFDDETKQKLDTHSKSMKSKIDAETIKRAQGKETTWKAPTTSNSQRSSTNTQTYSNFGNTYGGR